MYTSADIRKRFLDFFAARGHAILESAPLVTSDVAGATNATLFNTAGMQPLIPYLLGEDHPRGARLANSQKCLRTNDLDEVGDATHATFFEMLGNWSLGDYFKEDAICFSYEFLTNVDEGLGLDPERLYITVFAGNEEVPRDDESLAIWKSLGVPEHRIYFRDSKDNWWTAGENSPAGPSTEMFYDMTGNLGDMSPEKFEAADERGDVVEVWNDVFMTYRLENGLVAGELPRTNVDTGAGLERVTAVVQGKQNIFDTDLYEPLLVKVRELATTSSLRDERIIADHIKAVTFLTSESVMPKNTGRGYIVRRLIRRAVMSADRMGLPEGSLADLVSFVREIYQGVYQFTTDTESIILEEEKKYRGLVAVGRKKIQKLTDGGESISGKRFSELQQTDGIPFEVAFGIAEELGAVIDPNAERDFSEAQKQHQDTSRKGAEQKFKGGLSDATNENVVRLHTAHHLLLAALQEVLGSHVKQRGSNITEDRLRIDFAHDSKMTDEEKQAVEEKVNTWIQAGLSVVAREMKRDEAEATGAEQEFGAQYGDVVTVYFIENVAGQAISKEFCGGPHVANTKELGVFRIQKESASSAGVRRIKAVLE